MGQNPIFGPRGPGGGQKRGQNQIYVKNWSEKAEIWQTDLFLHQKFDFTNGFSQFSFFDPFWGSPGTDGGLKGSKNSYVSKNAALKLKIGKLTRFDTRI